MAYRFIIEEDRGELRLIGKQKVDMLAPAAGTETPGRHTGVYAELQNSKGEAIYQQSLSSQLEPSREVFSPDGIATRIETTDTKKILVLVLPEHDEAKALVFLSVPSPSSDKEVRAEASTGPQVIARFQLDDGDPAK